MDRGRREVLSKHIEETQAGRGAGRAREGLEELASHTEEGSAVLSIMRGMCEVWP